MKTIKNKQFKNTGFHHIAIKVRDFDKSYKFYTEILGFNDALAWGEAPERACMLDFGDGSYLELFEGGQSDGSLQSEPIIHFALATDECDAMYKAAMNSGCQSHMAPDDLVIEGKPQPLPIRISFVIGYDGELIEFFQCR